MSARPRILVIEDDPDLARATTRQLQALGDVEAALTADEARACMQLGAFDVVVSDYDLGTELADELLEELRGALPRAYRLLYSGSRPEEWRRLVRDGLVHAVLRKPASVDVLRGAVSVGLGRRAGR